MAALISSALNLVIAVGLLAWKGPLTGAPVDNALLFVSGVLLALYLIPYFKALDMADASSVAPLFQLVPVFVVLLGVTLGQRVAGWQAVGLTITVASSALFVLAAKQRAIRTRIVVLMILACSVLAVQALIVDHVLERHGFVDSLPLITAGICVTGIVGLAFTPRSDRVAWKTLGAVGLAALLAAELAALTGELLLIAAIALGPVALVALTTSLEPAFVFLLGVVLTVVGPSILKEDLNRRAVALKVGGCALAVLGVALSLR